MRWISSIPPTDITLYTDGSQDAAGNTGLGYVGFQRGYKVCEGYQSLGTAAEVYNVEIIAIEAGIRAAAQRADTQRATNIYVLLDNQEAACRALEGTPTDTSQGSILRIRQLATLWKRRKRAPSIQLGEIMIYWILGH